jgi:hypothetical protein
MSPPNEAALEPAAAEPPRSRDESTLCCMQGRCERLCFRLVARVSQRDHQTTAPDESELSAGPAIGSRAALAFVEEQRSQPASLLVVPSDRARGRDCADVECCVRRKRQRRSLLGSSRATARRSSGPGADAAGVPGGGACSGAGDDLGWRRFSVERRDLGAAALACGALIDVALVGDLVCVQ